MRYLYLIEALIRGERWAKRRAVEGLVAIALMLALLLIFVPLL